MTFYSSRKNFRLSLNVRSGSITLPSFSLLGCLLEGSVEEGLMVRLLCLGLLHTDLLDSTDDESPSRTKPRYTEWSSLGPDRVWSRGPRGLVWGK